MKALFIDQPGQAAAGAFPVGAAVTRVVPLEAAAEALREWSADPGPITRIHVSLA